MKRTDYINWDEYFMGIALLTAMRSKDPSSQVGACIVSPENKILSLGYNGMPIGCDDDAMPWEREGDPLDTKYMYVCHAELNAILNSAHNNLKGARVYVTLFPCNECAKAIIQSGRNCWSCDQTSQSRALPRLRGFSQNFPLKIQFIRYIIEPSYRINIHFELHREESIQ